MEVTTRTPVSVNAADRCGGIITGAIWQISGIRQPDQAVGADGGIQPTEWTSWSDPAYIMMISSGYRMLQSCCRDPRGWTMPRDWTMPRGWTMSRGRPHASWLRQVESYLKDMGMTGRCLPGRGWSKKSSPVFFLSSPVARWTRRRATPAMSLYLIRPGLAWPDMGTVTG